MSHLTPALVIGGLVVAVPNFLVQAAISAGDDIAAWGVFATTLCGGIGFLIKTYWDGKTRAAATAQALEKAVILQRQVDEFEARHKADMAWVEKMTEYLNGRIDRSRERVANLAGQVQVVTGSSDEIGLADTADVSAMPQPKPGTTT